MSVGAIVLAAGAGSRFLSETHKLRARFRGRPLVCWAVDAALGAGRDAVAAVAVVTGAADLDGLLPEDVAVVRNERWSSGQASSLRAGIGWCAASGHEAAVVGLADQPLVPASAWRAVALATHAPIVVATYGGRRRNPVRLASSVWPLLPEEGDEGARQLMRSRPELVGEIPCIGDAADVDTLEDLVKWS